MNYEHVTIFLTNGATLRFERVSAYYHYTSMTTFNYVSASDGKTNHATVYHNQIAMIAHTES